ncbi:MAG: hypothetical protein MUQ65_16685 [Armatimonadetes bacterium]|nr:hypothetical protein [Armatimonadota bacterium]
MEQPSLKDLCLDIMADATGSFLDLQWSDGRFATVPEHDADEWNFYDQQFILPAALLYVAEHPASPWYADPRLLQAVVRNGRHIAGRIGDDGAMQWNLRGVVLPSPFVCQRLTCAWLLAYRLLRPHLPDEDAALWRSKITQACEWLVNRHLIPHRDVARFTSHQVGTGTNHFALYLSLIWLAGTEFERSDWVELAADLMRRLIADQRPGGYWEEHHGPALGYNYLTYNGVEEYTTWSGDETGLAALRAGLDLHMNWTYPDGTAVECIDGRMRHLSGRMMWGLSGFTRWPDGRGYARLLLERLASSSADRSGETMARVAEAYLHIHEGDEIAAPQTQTSYRATLDEGSAIRKDGPWVVALSGQCSSPWPENQFCLDRQALVSVWHERAGLVVDGSNSKFQSELATFSRRQDGADDHMPLRAERVGGPDEEAVHSHYASFDATVRARVVSPGAVELRLSASAGPSPVPMALVPHASYGESLTLGTGSTLTLGDDAFALGPERHGGAIIFRGITMRLPEGASVEYPCSPFNSYSADNTSSPGANRLVIRCPVGEDEVTFRIEASD